MILKSLPTILLFILSLSGFLGGESLKCAFNKKHASNGSASYLYTAIVSLAAAVGSIALCGFKLQPSRFSVLLGLLFGVAVMANIVASSLAIRVGPWSYTSIMVSLGIIIPTFSGPIFFNEPPPQLLDYIGLVFMIVCFVCSVKKDKNEKKSNLKWLLLSIVAMLSISVVGILQKTHQSSLAHKDEIGAFLTIAFLFSAILSLILFFIFRKAEANGEKSEKILHGNRSLLFIMLGAGVATAFNHTINLYLSGNLESVLFFPVMCGGELIGVTLISVFLFKEKLSLIQWLGLASGAIAALLLCI